MYFESQEKNKEDKNRSITPWWVVMESNHSLRSYQERVLPLNQRPKQITLQIKQMILYYKLS